MKNMRWIVIILVLVISVLTVACNEYIITEEVDPPFDVYVYITYDNSCELYHIYAEMHIKAPVSDYNFKYIVTAIKDGATKEFLIDSSNYLLEYDKSGTEIPTKKFNVNQVLFSEHIDLRIELQDKDGVKYVSMPMTLKQIGISFDESGFSIDLVKLEFEPCYNTYTIVR